MTLVRRLVRATALAPLLVLSLAFDASPASAAETPSITAQLLSSRSNRRSNCSTK